MSEKREPLTNGPTSLTTLVLNDDLFRSTTRALGARTDRERCAVAGISRPTLHRWRRGTVVPSLAALRGVAQRLGVELSQLVREEAP